MHILRVLVDTLFRLSMQQNWPKDRKLPQSCWCSRWFLGLGADVWKIRLQVHTRLIVTQVRIEKMFQQKYRNRVSECSLSPLSASVSAIIAQCSDIKEGTNNWAWVSPFARYVRLEYGVIFACWIRYKLRLFTSLITLAVCFRSVNLLVDSSLTDLYVPFGILLNLCC